MKDKYKCDSADQTCYLNYYQIKCGNKLSRKVE